MSAFADWLAATSLSVKIQAVDWVIPLLQSIHIVTIGVVFVSSLMIALRVMGRMRADESFGVVWARFAPWMWYGLLVMLITGVLLIIGEPGREFTAISFWMKMTLVAVAVLSTAAFGRVFRSSTSAAAAPTTAIATDFSSGAKLAAAGLIVLWLAIIFLGRAIAYDVEVWGSLSLHT